MTENELKRIDKDSPAYSYKTAITAIIFLPVSFLVISNGIIALLRSLNFTDIPIQLSIALTSVSFGLSAFIFLLFTSGFKSIPKFTKLNKFSFKLVLLGLAMGLATYVLAMLTSTVAVLLGESMGVGIGKNQTSGSLNNSFETQNIFIVFFIATVFTPILEEFFFRGTMLNVLVQNSKSKTFQYFAVVLISVAFGFMHMQNPTGTIADFTAVAIPSIVGLVGGILTIKTQSLYPAIFSHMCYNGLVMLSLLGTHSMS